MSTKAILVPEYMVDEDASVLIVSDPMDLTSPLQSVSFQFCWSEGVEGAVTFYASVFPSPFKWENLVSCSEVGFLTTEATSDTEIISIPGLWLTAGFIKFEFQPNLGTSGTMSVAQRLVPT